MDGDVQELWTQMRIDHAVSAPLSSTDNMQSASTLHMGCVDVHALGLESRPGSRANSVFHPA
jgi:hypothetical protein